jgi:hypothetical protein
VSRAARIANVAERRSRSRSSSGHERAVNPFRGHSADTLDHVRKGQCSRALTLLILLARPRGFEPPASAFGGQRSIQLSYGRAHRSLADRSGRGNAARLARAQLRLHLPRTQHGSARGHARVRPKSAVTATAPAGFAEKYPAHPMTGARQSGNSDQKSAIRTDGATRHHFSGY